MSIPLSAARKVPLLVQLLIWFGLLGLLVLIAVELIITNTPVISAGSPVPDFTMRFYEGYEYENTTEIALSDLRGKVIVLNFWASWCKPCEGEAADLEQAWRYYHPSGKVKFFGIDYVDTEPEARSYLLKFDITYPNAPDLGTRISQIFNQNLGVPETYIIDQDGILRYVKIGPFFSVEEIKIVIDSILDGG